MLAVIKTPHQNLRFGTGQAGGKYYDTISNN